MPCQSFDAQVLCWVQADSQRTRLPCRLETLASKLEASKGGPHSVILPGNCQAIKVCVFSSTYNGFTVVLRS